MGCPQGLAPKSRLPRARPPVGATKPGIIARLCRVGCPVSVARTAPSLQKRGIVCLWKGVTYACICHRYRHMSFHIPRARPPGLHPLARVWLVVPIRLTQAPRGLRSTGLLCVVLRRSYPARRAVPFGLRFFRSDSDSSARSTWIVSRYPAQSARHKPWFMPAPA